MTASSFNVVYLNGAVPNVDVIYIYGGGSHTWKFLTYMLLNISLGYGINAAKWSLGTDWSYVLSSSSTNKGTVKNKMNTILILLVVALVKVMDSMTSLAL